MQALQDHFDADSISIKLEVTREKSLPPGRLWRAADSLLDLSDSKNVLELRIDGREFDEDSFKVIDLIQHREKRTRQLQVDDIERKVPHPDRWKALTDIRKKFPS